MKRVLILKNTLQGPAGLKTRSTGFAEMSEFDILLTTIHQDYYLVQLQMKLFAVPTWMIEKLVVR